MSFDHHLRGFIIEQAASIWMFLNSAKTICPSDCLMLLGSTDKRVASCGGELYRAHMARSVLVSGKSGRNTRDSSESEASGYKRELLNDGVNPDDILILEEFSTNTKEDFIETKKIYERLQHRFSSGIIVCQPHAMLRSLATARIQWSEISWSVWAPQTTLENFVDRNEVIGRAISELLGEIDRLEAYGAAGDIFLTPIPPHISASCEKLRALGFISSLQGKSVEGKSHLPKGLQRLTDPDPDRDPWS